MNFPATSMLTGRVKAATTPGARPARRLAALQLVAIEQLFRLLVPCQTPRGTHPRGRPTALSRLKNPKEGIFQGASWSGRGETPAQDPEARIAVAAISCGSAPTEQSERILSGREQMGGRYRYRRLPSGAPVGENANRDRLPSDPSVFGLGACRTFLPRGQFGQNIVNFGGPTRDLEHFRLASLVIFV